MDDQHSSGIMPKALSAVEIRSFPTLPPLDEIYFIIDVLCGGEYATNALLHVDVINVGKASMISMSYIKLPNRSKKLNFTYLCS